MLLAALNLQRAKHAASKLGGTANQRSVRPKIYKVIVCFRTFYIFGRREWNPAISQTSKEVFVL